MAVQLLPLIKTIAPYVTQVATVAIPAFTSKSSETVKSDPVVAKQIEELQAAATQNAQSVHLLAEKLQHAIQGIESAAGIAEKRIAAYKILLYTSLGCSVVSLLLAGFLLLR